MAFNVLSLTDTDDREAETAEQDRSAPMEYIEDICFFFSVKDRNLFDRVDTIGNIFPRGCATRENITDGVHEMK